jgi:hypothetical protein
VQFKRTELVLSVEEMPLTYRIPEDRVMVVYASGVEEMQHLSVSLVKFRLISLRC